MATSIFENTCRTCNRETTELFNIFEAKLIGQKILISDMLNRCGPIKLVSKDDDYPAHICHACAKLLEISYRFLNTWREAESEFEVALKFEKRRKRMKLEKSAKRKKSSQMGLGSYALVPPVKSNNQTIFLDFGNASTVTAEVDEETVMQHRQAEHTNESEEYICALCNKAFLTTYAIEIHQKLVHRDISFVLE